jgi:hypothetical protein
VTQNFRLIQQLISVGANPTNDLFSIFGVSCGEIFAGYNFFLQNLFEFPVMRPPLWSSGQSSWLQIRRPGFDSGHCQEKKSSGSATGSTQPREYN